MQQQCTHAHTRMLRSGKGKMIIAKQQKRGNSCGRGRAQLPAQPNNTHTLAL